MLDITCRRCGTQYHAELAHLGKRLKCTQCGAIIVIENQQPAAASLGASHVQPNQHNSPVETTAPKSHFRWAMYVGASALLITSLSIWRLHSRPQTEVVNQLSHPKSETTQQGDLHKDDPEQLSNPSRNLPPDTARNVVSNPFAAAPNDQSIATSGYSAPRLDPRPKSYHSLPNGARLGEDIGSSGHGTLSISNQTSLDAVVRLYNRSTLETVRWFFVKAHGSFTMKSIPEGNYNLAYSSGLDWVDSDDTFRWNPSYHEFQKTVTYSEQRDASGIQYDDINVTLHPVMGGNVRTKPISRSEFLKGHRHVSL